MIKKVVITLLIFICISTNVFAEEIIDDLLYWESNGSSIASFLSTTPYIYSNTLGGYNLTTLRTQVSNARNQWNGAGIPCNTTTSSSGAHIKVYAGTLAEIQNQYPAFNPGSAGETLLYMTKLSGVFLYNGNRKYYYRINSATIYIRTGLTYPQNVVTHEIGHGVGWLDHITTSGNVMYHEESSTTTLSPRDKRHLQQIH